MNYKKKNGHRKRDRFHGFRHKNIETSSSAGYNWSADSVLRRHVKAAAAVEEYPDSIDMDKETDDVQE